jgi:UPF0755 protein
MKKFLSFLGLLVIVLIIMRFWYTGALRPVNADDDTRVTLKVEEGSSLRTIAGSLEEKGLIRSARVFEWFAKRQGAAVDLKAGNFILQPSMNAAEVLQVLRDGFSEEVIVTIPEGFTVKDIDALLAEKELIEPGAVINCANECDFSAFTFLPSGPKLAKRGGRVEGYLYPDTYFVVRASFTAEDFLKRLLSTFEERVVKGMADEIQTSERSLEEIVSMASLVEEETRTDDERPVVAGILWKRFDAGQMLGVDAAVRYILNKPTADITRADLDVDSPYNLRKVAGLAPGPIANPSLASIKATLVPEDTAYWYYLHGTDGQIRFAKTNDEHNQNRARFLR